MRKLVILPALLCVSLTASSCATPGGGPLGFMMFDPNHHVPSAEPVFTRAEDECLTGSFLLSVFSGSEWTDTKRTLTKQQQVCADFSSRLRTSLFSGRTPPTYTESQRNDAVATLILASNKRCGDYVHFLQTYQGNVRATSGIAAQVLATVATLATGNTAQWFAAGSALSTGAGNTVYEVHFANKTVAMLTKAFDNARLERLRAIQDKMQCTKAQYPLATAVGDAFDYHTSCSLTTGLMAAQDAVDQQRSPNLETLAKLAEQIDAARTKLLKLGTGPQSTAPGGTPTPAPPPAGSAPNAAAGGNGGGGGAAAASTGGSSQSTSNAVATATPSTGTGGVPPPLQTHAPTCPFNAAQTQTQAVTPDAKPNAKPETKAKSKKA